MKENDILKPPAGQCLCCGKPVYGRTDKKYCNNVCKNIANNRRRASAIREKYRFIDILDRNYLILKRILESGRSTMNINKIQALGFDPGTCSRITFGRRGFVCHCYDIEYRRTDSKVFAIRLTPSEPSLKRQASQQASW